MQGWRESPLRRAFLRPRHLGGRHAIAMAVLLAAALGAMFVPTKWLRSAGDRSIRLLSVAAPDWAHRLRHAEKQPLAARLSVRGFSLGDPAFIRIFKEENQLEIWIGRKGAYELFEAYPICSWSGDLGPKLKEGDGQSPEGFYAVGLKQLNPASAYHRSFDLGFPNAYDRAQGRTGSFLMVHGDCLSVGCYAMGDAAIDDIFQIVEAALRHGQPEVPVQAFPFRLTEENLASRAGQRWASEWAGLKEGYDRFEATGTPPLISLCDGRYAFGSSTPPGCTAIKAW